ncbi:VP6 [Marbled eel reovirus]|nr:VP6 [Marbled eel reovirus]
MAQRNFRGFTPNFYGLQHPTFDRDDLSEIAGCASKPWQGRWQNLLISVGSSPVWSGRYPSVAARQLILNAIVGAHSNQFSAGVIASYDRVTWRDAVLSYLSVIGPVPPPVWVPMDNLELDSNRYPSYGINESTMWPVRQDIHIMSMWAISDRGPVYSVSRPAGVMPTAVSTALSAYIGTAVVHLAITAYTYSGQLPQTPDSINTQVFRWLSVILFGSMTGRINKVRTIDGFYFDFGKTSINPDTAILKWIDGPRSPALNANMHRHFMCASPHWQHALNEVAQTSIPHAYPSVAGIGPNVGNLHLPVWAHNVRGFTGGGGARNVQRYNYVTLAEARHRQWERDQIIDNATRLQFDQDFQDYALAIEQHLTGQLAVNPVNLGRMVIQPFVVGDFAPPYETNAVVQSAVVMFP